MKVINEIETDMKAPGVRPMVYAMQADEGSRSIKLSLFEDGSPWVIPENITVSVAYQKPDKTKGMYDTLPDGSPAVTYENNTITLEIAPQVLTAHGAVFMSAVLSDTSSRKISVFPIIINVVANPAAGSSPSDDYYWLTTLAAIGNLDDLETVEKTNLVAAINEAAKKGANTVIYVLSEGETLEDVPDDAVIVIDPYGTQQ